MKKKVIFAVFLASISIITTIAAIGIENSRLNELAISNLEALTDPEGIHSGDYVSYDFGGQYWHGKKETGAGNMFPEYINCSIDGYNGHQVYCTSGRGNCWNGTDCLKDI